VLHVAVVTLAWHTVGPSSEAVTEAAGACWVQQHTGGEQSVRSSCDEANADGTWPSRHQTGVVRSTAALGVDLHNAHLARGLAGCCLAGVSRLRALVFHHTLQAAHSDTARAVSAESLQEGQQVLLPLLLSALVHVPVHQRPALWVRFTDIVIQILLSVAVPPTCRSTLQLAPVAPMPESTMLLKKAQCLLR
jgi:hypothetical protein